MLEHASRDFFQTRSKVQFCLSVDITVCFLACIPVCHAENDPVSEHAYLQDFPWY